MYLYIRYVREWLAILAVSKVINVDKEKNTYFLPRNRGKFLNSPFSRFSFEVFFTMFPQILPQLETCFSKGGGISYDSYAGFHAWMDSLSTLGHKMTLLQHHIPSIEGLHEKLESGICCLDVGCGMGSPGLLLAKQYPKSQFYGFDISEEAITLAKEEADKLGLQNVHFLVKDCSKFYPEYEEMFDYISANDAIHDQAYPAATLSSIFKMIKKGGIFSMVDVDAHSHPADNINVSQATLKYTLSLMHCMPVSLYFEGGAGLGTCWGRELATQMLKEAGFSNVVTKDYAGGSFNLSYIATKECDMSDTKRQRKC